MVKMCYVNFWYHELITSAIHTFEDVFPLQTFILFTTFVPLLLLLIFTFLHLFTYLHFIYF